MRNIKNNYLQITSFLSVLWFTVLVYSVAEYTIQGISKENIKYDEKLSSAMITAGADVSFKECIALCYRRPRCLSINYMPIFLMCELNFLDKSYPNSKFVRNLAVIYTEKGTWKTKPSYSFKRDSCRENEEYAVGNGGLTLCVISDCGIYLANDSNTIPNVDNGIGIYSKVTYHCEDSNIPRGKPYIGCQANGNWSPMRFQCWRECQELWTMNQSSCYRITPFYGDWNTLKNYCNSENAMLAEISSGNEQVFIENLLKSNGLTIAWIGGTDIQSEGTWKWTNSNTVFWSKIKVPPSTHYIDLWHSGQPDDAGNNEDCSEGNGMIVVVTLYKKAYVRKISKYKKTLLN